MQRQIFTITENRPLTPEVWAMALSGDAGAITRPGQFVDIALEGRLDSESAPEFQKELGDSLFGVKELVLDFEKLEYMSSAGVRVLIWTVQTLGHRGTMRVVKANDMIREIFEITGLNTLLANE